MHVTINGEEKTLDEGLSVESYLRCAGLGETPCAVEINKRLIPRREHATTLIREGDSVEVVTLVGGG